MVAMSIIQIKNDFIISYIFLIYSILQYILPTFNLNNINIIKYYTYDKADDEN